MNSNTQTREIVQLGMDACYLDARKAVAERKMRLPPHPLLDAYVQKNGVYGFWADELLVHPEKGGVFQSGKDVQDSLTGWILPASYMPKEAVGRKEVGLYVVPEDVGEERGKVIVHAQSVIVLDGITQVSDKWVAGKPHDITRIPLVVSSEEFERLPEEEKRWLYRIAGEGVRPLVRGAVNDWYGNNMGCVYADFGPGIAFGVAGVLATEGGAPEQALQKLQVETAPEDRGVLIKGASVEQVKALLADARGQIDAVLQTVNGDKLGAVVKLLDALQIKE